MDEAYKAFEKLKEARGVSSYRVAKETGIRQTTLSDWKVGRIRCSLAVAKKLADYFGVPVDTFAGSGAPVPEPSTDHSHWVPVLGSVAAGLPAEMISDILGWEEVDDSVGESFALKVSGDSMSPFYLPGDVVIVKRQEDVESGDVAVVAVNGEEGLCKKILKSEAGVMLVSLNPAYAPRFFTNEEIINLPVRILGRVVELRRTV